MRSSLTPSPTGFTSPGFPAARQCGRQFEPEHESLLAFDPVRIITGVPNRELEFM